MKDKPRFHGLMFHHFHNNYHPKGQGSISSETFENILRVQYYCQMNDIENYMFWWKDELVNYKMSKYSKKLYEQIQKMNTTWLPNLGDWCVFNTDLKQEDLNKGYHPTKAQHDAFGEEVLRHIK